MLHPDYRDMVVAFRGRRHLLANKRASGRKKDLLDAEWLESRQDR